MNKSCFHAALGGVTFRNVDARALAIAVLVACGGCAAEPDVPAARVDDGVRTPTSNVTPAPVWRIVLDPSTPAWEESVVRRSLGAWERVIPCAVAFVVERRVVTGLHERLPPAFVVEIRMGTPPAGVGWADWDPRGEFGARIVFLPNGSDSDRADFPRVVEHELGHAFHLEHTTEGLMAHPPKAHVRVGTTEGLAFAAKWCPASTLRR